MAAQKLNEDQVHEPDLVAAKAYLCEIAGITPTWFNAVASFKAGTVLGIFSHAQNMTSLQCILKHMHKVLGPDWARSIVKKKASGWIFNHFTLYIDGRERRVSLNYRPSSEENMYYAEFDMHDRPIEMPL